MTGAEETSLSPAQWGGLGEAAPAARAPRRRLFRKYALIFVALVGAALLINSSFDFWFSYQENKAALVRVQQEKAESAAQRIAEFVEEIKSQIGWTTHAQWAAGPLDQRRQDYVRLLRQVPAITELAQLDGAGKECLKVSRLAMDVVNLACDGPDWSQSPAFTEAKAKRTWFSPVYFRKESEPYMTLAMARDGRNAGVTVAEINLKLIWDVITALKIGQGGYAYVIDGRGRLIAHPDISLVLRDTDLSKLPQVAAALTPQAGQPAVATADNLAGRSVLTAHAAIPQLGWRVFVEVPLSEAFAPLYGAAMRTALLLAGGLIAAALVALILARRMTGPIRAIAATAERIGTGDLSHRIDIHTGDELEGLAQRFNRMAGDLQKSYAELEQRVADRTAELSEALDQQTATAEVLRVINSSPGDLAPVFEAMLDKAMRLCEAAFGSLWTFSGDRFRPVAHVGLPAAYAAYLNQDMLPAGQGTGRARLLAGEPFAHIPDLADEPPYRAGEPHRLALVDLGGARTGLLVPLRKDAAVIGFIMIYRQEVRPFSDKQIALLLNFAAQAVIAMENARLITETREALEQQTATAEVLGVINSSPGDLAPVFEAMLEKALRLCDAALGHLYMHDRDRFEPAAALGDPEFSEWLFRRGTISPVPNSPLSRILKGERCVEIPDARETEAYRAGGGYRELVDSSGTRTHLAVPLRKDGAVLGVITIYRKEVRPFTDKQIALLQNFAGQAVIAMENARLITETREALEQQTATAEVLGVINSSPGELVPVFDAMLEKAMRLCEAAFGFLTTYDGQEFSAAAQRGVPPKLAEYFTAGMDQPQPGDSHWRLLAGEDLVHNIDQMDDDAYRSGSPLRRAVVDLGGARSALVVALRKDNTLLGAFTIYRKEVRAFSGKQIALVQNFAAQAVIAMENARLITETREALEQQTATAEILRVVSGSQSDVQPVFEAIVESASKLCEAELSAVTRYDGTQLDLVALNNMSPEEAAAFQSLFPRAATPNFIMGRAFVEGRPVNVEDVLADPAYDLRTREVLAGPYQYRSFLAVPILRDGEPIGVIGCGRREVKPFTAKQIELVRTFADQAVIAIENARLITETREALEQQTATAEVLGVINASPGDLAPVFDAMLKKATSLCGAAFGIMNTFDGEQFNTVALHGVPRSLEESLISTQPQPGPHSGPGRMLSGEDTVCWEDMAATPAYQAGDVRTRALVDLGGVRSYMAAALRKDGRLLGTLAAYRQEVRPFSDKQIALLQNFAAQAVIAMENARLLTETRDRTRDLQESLEYQTATSDVLSVISRSTFDLQPVLDTLVETAARLCAADTSHIVTRDRETYRPVATFGYEPDFDAFVRGLWFSPGRDTVVGRVLLDGQIAHVEDTAADPEYLVAGAVTRGARTQLGVPLLREGERVGVIVLARLRVEPFSERQIELVRTFADQAVIAIENARLLNELRDRTADLQESLEYQTATSDVLKVISQSGTNLDPALDTLVETAARLCAAERGIIWRLRDRQYHLAASFGFSGEFRELMASNPIEPGRGTLGGRTLAEGRPVQICDAATDPEYTWTEAQRLGEFHSMLGVPLFRDRTPIGVIAMVRSRVEPFTDKEIQLVSTFADQAVIAIENARLLGELRERTDELGRSVEELKTLAEVGQAVSSTLDLEAILSTVLNRSVGLTEADAGVIFRYSEGERAFHLAEAVGWGPGLIAQVRDMRIDQTATLMGEAVTRRTPGQITDLRERASNVLRDATLAAGYRSVLVVPLVGADEIFGALLLQRRRPGEFPEAEVRLMQTLAAQSVLAIQNAGLFREIADKSEQLALASQHKSQFLANMSHELRTPLNAILGYSELLVDGIYGAVPEKAMGVLERVQNNGKHLLALINDVLDLSKIEAGQLVLTLEDYALPDVVHSVVSAAESLANTKGLKFSADVAPGLPTGHGDARRLSQVLLNLVGNAIKFTDEGEVAVGAIAENGHFVLTVRDTGPGIAPEDHDKIFGEFQQVDNSNTRKKGGTGLGLAISKRMVEMQGGSIVVESKLGHGATFRVTLPIRVEQVAEELAGELMGAA